MENTKQIGKYTISLWENIGRFKVAVESEDSNFTETYTVRYEAQERYDSLEDEKDAGLFLKDNEAFEEEN